MDAVNQNQKQAEPLPCCPCVDKKVMSTSTKINLAIFGTNVAIGAVLLIAGIALLIKSKMRSGRPAGGAMTTSIWLMVIGGIFVLGSLAPLIIVASGPQPIARVPQSASDCRDCLC